MTVQGLFVLFPGSGVSVEPDNHWGSQINQLEQLIDKLECEVCMGFTVKPLRFHLFVVQKLPCVCVCVCSDVRWCTLSQGHFFKVYSGAIRTPW